MKPYYCQYSTPITAKAGTYARKAGKATVMQNWGIQGKFPWASYYGQVQDEGNWPILRPMQTRMYPRNANTVPPNIYTPYLMGPMVWQPNFPLRQRQALKNGGQTTPFPGMVDLAAAQYQMRAMPSITATIKNWLGQ